MALRNLTNWRSIIYGVENTNDYIKIEKERENDVISHYILRLAFSKSEHLRRWFLANELELFRVRLKALSLDSASFTKFIHSNDVGYPLINSAETIFPQNVQNAYFGSSTKLYVLPFAEAVELVGKRAVLLHKGNAYLTQNQLMPSVCSLFRTYLSQSLSSISNSLGNLFDEDNRMQPILEELSMDLVENDIPANHSELKLYIKHFPLCMRVIHEVLRQLHHMRHWGRQQYGLFLKAIGLPLEESLKFWREEFTHKMDVDKFEKNYAYNIRHNYGKEGRRTDYTPHSCMRIISNIGPSTGECYGMALFLSR
ncbi:DNA primase large subunit-like [Octopus sinensis]|uniref:DNA primase large subunit n=1 Tax=Octopus sinensis TaxID=2607531 RepID=A0A6P7TVG7_9MOLL|nr:DNA primase large subunit-like [Octopus sinensis]